MIVRKSADELRTMARAGAVVATALDEVVAAAVPGVTTRTLDGLAERVIRASGAVPSFKGYRGFPASLCTSRNDEVVHGIPSGDVVLADGDLLSIDCGAVVDGFHADAAVTVVVGDRAAAHSGALGLCEATRTGLRRGIAAAGPGGHLGDIGAAIAAVATRGGYGNVRDYVGHGVGRALHEDPSVPNHGTAGTGILLEVGLVVAIEPMFTLGADRTVLGEDGWTVVTADGSLAAHWEHTVAVTADGPVVLTAGERDRPGAGAFP